VHTKSCRLNATVWHGANVWLTCYLSLLLQNLWADPSTRRAGDAPWGGVGDDFWRTPKMHQMSLIPALTPVLGAAALGVNLLTTAMWM
jgi:hypothetical protein